MDKYLEYHNLLRSRNLKGLFYRKYFLYPRLNRYTYGKKLDIGCGIGDYLQNSNNCIGVDINIHNIQYVNNLGFEAYLIKEDKIPFPNKHFNSIILDNVLEHIENPKPLLDEIKRISSKDAILIVGVPGIKGFKRDPTHQIFYDAKSLETLIKQFGFIRKKTIYLPFNLKFLSKLITQFCLYQIYERDFSEDQVS